jgi:hypothetical protein
VDIPSYDEVSTYLTAEIGPVLMFQLSALADLGGDEASEDGLAAGLFFFSALSSPATTAVL